MRLSGGPRLQLHLQGLSSTHSKLVCEIHRQFFIGICESHLGKVRVTGGMQIAEGGKAANSPYARDNFFVLEPVLRVAPAGRDVIHRQGHRQQHQRARAYGDERIEPAEVVHLLAADDGDERGGASRGMNGPGCQHGDDGQRHRRRGRQPGGASQQLPRGHADEGGDDMAADEVRGWANGLLTAP